MKKLALVLTLILIGCAAKTPVTPPVPPPVNKDFTIIGKWSYDMTNMIPCSSTLTTGCVIGFTWGYLNGTTQVPLKIDGLNVCTGTTQPESCTDTTNSQLPIGSLTFFVSANYITTTGATGSATTNTVQALSVAAVSPTNLSFSVQ